MTSGNDGTYEFADMEEAWYYVEVMMSGPLTGMTVAPGTDNPSALIGIGDGVTDLVFEFESE